MISPNKIWKAYIGVSLANAFRKMCSTIKAFLSVLKTNTDHQLQTSNHWVSSHHFDNCISKWSGIDALLHPYSARKVLNKCSRPAIGCLQAHFQFCFFLIHRKVAAMIKPRKAPRIWWRKERRYQVANQYQSGWRELLVHQAHRVLLWVTPYLILKK